MDKIVVIGGGGHAKVLISILKKCSCEVVGYTDDYDRGNILGVSYLGNDSILKEIGKESRVAHAVVGIGKVDCSDTRLRIQEDVKKLGFAFPIIISPRASVNEDVALDEGTVVFDGAVINSGAHIGRSCIINSNSTVEHDCRLGDNVHLGPGATVSGGVTIGDNCMIGVGACIIHSVSVSSGALIGAGSIVVKNIEFPGTYAGTPAKKIRYGVRGNGP
jgi:sugar O-acyltransferase (sialic acid O-acetyltransferase NeuD family)